MYPTKLHTTSIFAAVNQPTDRPANKPTEPKLSWMCVYCNLMKCAKSDREIEREGERVMDRKNLEIPIGVIAKVVLSLQTNEMICTLSHKRTVVINRGDFRQFEWQLTPRRETNTPKTTI